LNGWPALLVPFFDGDFISLRGSLYWLLPTPSCLSQEPPHVIAMIAHAKDALNHFSHPPGGPHVSSKAIGFGSFGQQRGNLRFLFCC
jgi:hypothetical protein